jgi:pimeloyl-ACP methyl ester carboxylesterase
LAANGVATLVFDYSGYGRSTGSIDWTQCELDAAAAFQHLQRIAPQIPVSILGFSLGSGIAAAIIDRIQPANLILGEAFTSFREAARCAHVPAALASHVPPIWDARQSLRGCTAPVLIVHGENDGLFPVQMARDLLACCPGPAELVLIPGFGHNQPFRRPTLAYWGPIVTRLLPRTPA